MRVRYSRLVAVLLVFLFVAMAVPRDIRLTSATTSTGWISCFPSSYNETLLYNGETQYPSLGCTMAEDSYYSTMGTPRYSDSFDILELNDFTNPSYHMGGFGASWINKNLPPSTATITQVFLAAVPGYGSHNNLWLGAKINHAWTAFIMPTLVPAWNVLPMWGVSTTISCAVYLSNVTANETWTPAMFKDSSTIVAFEADIPTDAGFQVDYVGWIIEYTLPIAGGFPLGTGGPVVTPPGGPPGSISFPSFGPAWLVDILAACMAMTGFVGMVGYPAYAIKNHQRGEEIGGSLASGLILEFLFIGMLYAGVVIAGIVP